MSSWPLTSAFHCSFGLKSDAPGYTCTSRSTFAALASRAMICTISSRTSPRPPGNWCEARSVVGAARTPVLINANTAAATAAHLSGIMRILLRKLAYSATETRIASAGLPANHLPRHRALVVGRGVRGGAASQARPLRRGHYLLPRHPGARAKQASQGQPLQRDGRGADPAPPLPGGKKAEG